MSITKNKKGSSSNRSVLIKYFQTILNFSQVNGLSLQDLITKLLTGCKSYRTCISIFLIEKQQALPVGRRMLYYGQHSITRFN